MLVAPLDSNTPSAFVKSRLKNSDKPRPIAPGHHSIMRTLRTKNSLTLLVRFFVHSKVLESFGPGTRPWFFCSCMPQVLTTHPWLLEWSGQLIKPKPLKDLVVTVQLSPPWFSGTYFSHTVKAEIWNWREDLSICPRPTVPLLWRTFIFQTGGVES